MSGVPRLIAAAFSLRINASHDPADFEKDDITIYHGDLLDVLPQLPEASVDCVVTDPPYGLRFMEKGWDNDVPGPAYWQAIARVCKPGALLLAFGGTRTHHRLTCAIEDAGWEIRDCLMWLARPRIPEIAGHLEGYRQGGRGGARGHRRVPFH